MPIDGVYSRENNDPYFKNDYHEASENHFNTATPLLSRLSKKDDLTGKQSIIYIPTGPAGGFGGLRNDYFPQPGNDSGEQIAVTSVDIFQSTRVQLKAIESSKSQKGSYFPVITRSVELAVKSCTFMLDLLLHGDGTARIGKSKATGAFVSGTNNQPVVEFDTAEWNKRWWYKNMLLEVGNAGDTDVEDGLFKVVKVDNVNKRVTFSRVRGSFELATSTNANGRFFYIQNMFKAAPQGIESVINQSSGNFYGLDYDENYWGSYRLDWENAPFSVELLNKMFTEQHQRVDAESEPDLILVTPEIWADASTDRETFKQIQIQPKDPGLAKAGMGFAALEYTTPGGKVCPLVMSKHLKYGRVCAINSDMFTIHRFPGFGWVNHDGLVWLRQNRQPYFEAEYGGFLQAVIHPTFQAIAYRVGPALV